MTLLLSLLSAAHAGAILTVRPGDDMLLAFDPPSGSFTEIGTLGVDFDFGGLAWDPNQRVLYLAPGRAAPGLFTVDIQTGAATPVGRHGLTDVFSLAFDPASNTLFAGQASQATGLSVLSTTTGAATPVFDPGFGMSGAAWFPSAQGILTNSIATSEFYLVDPFTRTSTLLGSGGVWLNDAGLAIDPRTDLVWTFDWSGQVYSFDPAARFRAERWYGTGNALDGAEYVPDVQLDLPELRLTQGSCPGPVTLEVTNATPNAQLAVVRGTQLGGFTVPVGGCRGTLLPLQNTRLLSQTAADARGRASLPVTLPPQACGLGKLQVVDLSSCALSNLLAL